MNKPNGLLSLTANYGSENINYRNRIAKNYKKWLVFQDKTKNNRKSKGLTDYANELLEGKMKPLYNLVFDYAGSRMFITKEKHLILEHIRKISHAGNVESQLKNMLIDLYNEFRISGQMRNSDANIINKYK